MSSKKWMSIAIVFLTLMFVSDYLWYRAGKSIEHASTSQDIITIGSIATSTVVSYYDPNIKRWIETLLYINIKAAR